MTRSINSKLILSFILVSVVGILLAVVITRWLTVREFQQLVLEQSQNFFIEATSTYYRETGTWQGVKLYLSNAPRIRLPAQPVHPPNDRLPQVNFSFALADENGRIVVPTREYLLGERVPTAELENGVSLELDGEFIGTVLTTGELPTLDPREQVYLDRTNRVLSYAAAGAVFVALMLGIFLSQSLTHPLRELTQAIRAMSHGKLGLQVPVRSQDEIGILAETFNQMSAELERLNEQREQMTADIAHDLRTPLTVLGGYLEAMREGVLKPTPERLETMHAEIQGLIRLVEDLRTLSLADAGILELDRRLVAPESLLIRTAAVFEHEANTHQVDLRIETHPSLINIQVDPERFYQVLNNLVSNAIRHTGPGGQITLSARPESGEVQFLVEDTGDGILAKDLPFIFDRLYRVSKAREHTNHETGLGLAISKSIVEAHGGTISASSEGQGKGSRFSIQIPVKGSSA